MLPVKRSISYDLVISLVLVVAVVSMGAIGLNYYLTFRQADRQYLEKAEEYLAYFQQTLAGPLWNYNDHAIQRVAESFVRSEIVDSLRILDTHGRKIFEMADNEAGSAPPGFKSAVIRYTDRNVDEIVGEVQMTLSRKALTERKKQLLWTSLITLGLVISAVGGSTGLLLRVFLRKPMSTLQHAIERIAAGDYEYQPDLPLQKEVTAILEKFNLMAEKIQAREEALSEINESLEQRVEQRTRELSETNSRLRRETDQRKKANQSLRARDALLHAILESSAEGIIAVDQEPSITHANQRFWQMWATPQHVAASGNVEIVRNQMLKSLNPADAENYPIRIKEIYDSNENDLEILNCKDGRVLERYSCPLLIDSENRGRIWAFRDITDRVRNEEVLAQAKEAAEEANRAKSGFLAAMSHEIRTPMNGVIGMSALLRQTALNEEQLSFVDTIDVSANALLNVINDILDYSKVEAGKLELERIEFDLRRIIEETADMLAVKADEKGLDFGCMIDTDTPVSIVGDPGRLRQVIVNLVSNAIKFTEQGSVAVRMNVAEKSGEEVLVRFVVSDTGIGIPKDRRNCLFQSFSQVDASTTRKYGGTGLGLAISRQLVEMMGGSIGVESKDGLGATFWFTARFKLAVDHLTKSPAIPRDLDGKHILAVDDNTINQEIIQAYLKKLGCHVELSFSAPEALALLHRSIKIGKSIDAVIIDHMMPDMDGEDLAKAIRGDAKFDPIKLILLTSSTLHRDSLQEKPIQFDGYLTKPVKRDRLVHVLQCALNSGPALDAALASNSKTVRTDNADHGDLLCKVLLAEDNAINQMVAAQILKKSRCSCEIAKNGKEAVELFRHGHYDIILMDIQMPVMDGMTATQRIRKLECQDSGAAEKPAIPIIALTANAMKGDREKYIRAGMDDYLAKPMNPDELLEKLRFWVSKRHGQNDESVAKEDL